MAHGSELQEDRPGLRGSAEAVSILHHQRIRFFETDALFAYSIHIHFSFGSFGVLFSGFIILFCLYIESLDMLVVGML